MAFHDSSSESHSSSEESWDSEEELRKRKRTESSRERPVKKARTDDPEENTNNSAKPESVLDNVEVTNFEECHLLTIDDRDINQTLRLRTIDHACDAPPVMEKDPTKYKHLRHRTYYAKGEDGTYISTGDHLQLLEDFNSKVLRVIFDARDNLPQDLPESIENNSCECDPSDSDDSHDESSGRPKKSKKKNTSTKRDEIALREVSRKRFHPAALSSEIAFNETGQKNTGSLCYCANKDKNSGIRHDCYVGEKMIPKCNMDVQGKKQLYHYILRVKSKLIQYEPRRSEIKFENEIYSFDGYSIFFHSKIPENLNQCLESHQTEDNLSIEYDLVECKHMPMFTVRELDLFGQYLFDGIMEYHDLSWFPKATKKDLTEHGCKIAHVMPRFIMVDDGAKEVLPMAVIIKHIVDNFKVLCTDEMAHSLGVMRNDFQSFRSSAQNKILVNLNKRPVAIRADMIDECHFFGNPFHDGFPIVTHHTFRVPDYSLANLKEYKDKIRQFSILKKEFQTNKNIGNFELIKIQMNMLEKEMKEIRHQATKKKIREVRWSAREFMSTGIGPDLIEHGTLACLIVSYVRFNNALDILEQEKMQYKFKDRRLLKLALSHISKYEKLGTNSDHVKNSLRNVGYRRNRYSKKPKVSTSTPLSKNIDEGTLDQTFHHNERLEFLGDAIVELITTQHLYLTCPTLKEGGMATFRTAIVQNKNLANLAEELWLHDFMLYAHGPDLCNQSDIRHAMANTFEALMGAIHLDGGTEHCKNIIGRLLFKNSPQCLEMWDSPPIHSLLQQYPKGDRHLAEKHPYLEHLKKFEEHIGMTFKSLRLLAKVFCRASNKHNSLTEGDYQRLEFLGDSVLQLAVTEFLYLNLPTYDEGRLSQLRTCLVSNKTQACISEDLNLSYFLMPTYPTEDVSQIKLKMKEKADLVEALIGAMFIDRGLDACRVFIRAMYMSRLKYFITDGNWKDSKTNLQQFCLANDFNAKGKGSSGLLPYYKAIRQVKENNRLHHVVAVYFKEVRIGLGKATSIPDAEQAASLGALRFFEKPGIKEAIFTTCVPTAPSSSYKK
uniref:RNase III domain-containing protein n=1 Tax=Rhabditophanes sp. KR3021 TaxID=114890 RepID=A0AC35TXV0_9BILA